jgi:biopolymer transport protein ExbD
MASAGAARGLITGINVTPLVDITLVLLIIFVVTAKIIVTPAVPLDLPSSAQAEGIQVVFSVVLPERGATMVDAEAVTSDEELVARAKEVRLRSPGVRAVVHADGAVPHRRVVHVLDLLARGGIQKVAFGATPLAADAAARSAEAPP